MTCIGIKNSSQQEVIDLKKINIVESLPTEGILVFLLDRVDRFS
jgi:hypothetical protein